MKALFMSVAVAALSIGQPAGGSVAGSWAAQFEGTTFVRIELNSANGGITGGISLGNIEVDDRGTVRRATASPPGLTPISDVKQRGSILEFLLKEGDEPDRFEFRLVEGGRAELHMLLNEDDLEELKASGIPAPRPILLTKQ